MGDASVQQLGRGKCAGASGMAPPERDHSLSRYSDAVPVRDVPELAVPVLRTTPPRLLACADTRPRCTSGMMVIVSLVIMSLSFLAISARLRRFRRSCRVRRPARHRPACRSAGCWRPATVSRDAGAFSQPVDQIGLRVGAVEVVGVHFDVGVELLEGVRGGRIAAEEHRCVDVAQLGFDADAPTTTA
jgi:hypothetical protein